MSLDHGSGDDGGVVKGLRRGFGCLLAVKGLESGGEVFHASEIDVFGEFGMGLGLGFGVVGGSGFRIVVGIDGRISVIRRGFQRRGFQFGVQRIVLDLFRI